MVYFVGFVADFGVPKSVNSGLAGPAAATAWTDLGLIVAFGLSHSLLARPAVRKRIAGWVSGELERSVFSIAAGLQVVLLMALWRPLPELVWSLPFETARVGLWSFYALGWGLVVWALAAIGSGHLFGWRAALAAARDQSYRPPGVRAAGPYARLQHPLYAGTALALFAAPDMSQGRLLLAVGLSSYILVGVRLEERDLAREHGAAYARYHASVPRFLPRPGRPPIRDLP